MASILRCSIVRGEPVKAIKEWISLQETRGVFLVEYERYGGPLDQPAHRNM